MNEIIINKKYLALWFFWVTIVCAIHIYLILLQPHIILKLKIILKNILAIM